MKRLARGFPKPSVRALVTSLLVALAFALALLMPIKSALAHKASDAWLELTQHRGEPSLRLDIALRDLNQVIDLDPDGNGAIEWRSIHEQRDAINALVGSAFELSTEAGPCTPIPAPLRLARREDGVYASLGMTAGCPGDVEPRTLRYRFLAGVDPTHRLIVSSPGAPIRVVLPDDLPVRVDPANEEDGDSRAPGWVGFVTEGVRHILGGTDHLAFVLALLIPILATATRTGQGLAPTLAGMLKLVTLFTVAHSITLSLTALRLISAPSRLIESLIALSVAIAGWHAWKAARNTGDASSGIAASVVFAFGLVHGFGFGSALIDAGFSSRSALPVLLGFNIGVELGQLLVIAALFPLAWALRDAHFFARRVLPMAAIAITVFGSAWLVERAFDLTLMPTLAGMADARGAPTAHASTAH